MKNKNCCLLPYSVLMTVIFFVFNQCQDPIKKTSLEMVTLKFQAHPGSTAGEVFGCFILMQGKTS